MYYPTKFDDVIWSKYWVISKITCTNLCNPTHGIINYSTFICPFVPGKCGKEGKNTKISIPGERKDLFRWNKKTFFIVFEGLSFGEKIKIW